MVWLAFRDKVHLGSASKPKRCRETDNGGQWLLFRKQLILLFFSSTPLQNKARFVSAEHSYSNWKKLSLNEAVGKINCKNSSGLSSCHQKILAIRRVFFKKPRRDALFKNKAVCCANKGRGTRRTKSSTQEKGPFGNF